MKTNTKRGWANKPIVRILLTTLSLLILIVGLVSLFSKTPNYISGLLLIGLATIYIWTEIQLIRNPKVLELVSSSSSNIQTSKNELAFWWQRLSSLIIDFIISFSLVVCILLFFEIDIDNSSYVLASVIFIYYVFSETLFQTTIGKAIFGLIVTDTRNELKPHLTVIIVRTLCRFIPFEALSFLSLNPNGWHDSFSNTAVIKK